MQIKDRSLSDVVAGHLVFMQNPLHTKSNEAKCISGIVGHILNLTAAGNGTWVSGSTLCIISTRRPV